MAKKKLKRGLFITFEGVEGCGKSTHSRRIYNLLRRLGYEAIYVREPGGTRIGEKIRGILLDPRNREMSDRTELFLFEANRAQIMKEVIKPALKKAKLVISDRFSDSTTAYQGYADRLDLNLVEKMNEFASFYIRPDLTIVLDIKPGIGLRRAVRGRRKDRMERKLISYHKRVRAGYGRLARRFKKRVRLIRVRSRIEQTQDSVRREVLNVVEKYKRPG